MGVAVRPHRGRGFEVRSGAVLRIDDLRWNPAVAASHSEPLNVRGRHAIGDASGAVADLILRPPLMVGIALVGDYYVVDKWSGHFLLPFLVVVGALVVLRPNSAAA